MNKLRKIIQKTGFDFHRHQTRAQKIDFLKQLDIKTVLDIGANIGQFATEIRQTLPNSKIYSFEPLKECFDNLNIKFKNDKNFKSFQFALGDKKEEVSMFKNEYLPSSSLLKLSHNHTELFPNTSKTTEEKISIVKLDDLKLELEKNTLIKIDAQGYEDKIINGGLNTFSKARVLLIETSFIELYEGQPLFDDIYELVKKIGFVYKGSLQEKVNKKTGEIISEDSIFIK